MAQELLVTPSAGGQKLFNFLKRSLDADNNEIHRWIRTGQVRINKKRAKAFDLVQEGDLIRIPPFAQSLTGQNSSKQPSAALTQAPTKPLPFPVVYENEHILVINKPAGLTCQGGTGQQKNIADMLKDYYCRADFIPAPAHRLDKNTSGLLLIGKTYQALRFLTEVMKGDEATLTRDLEHAPKKIYHALVYGDIRKFAEKNPYLCHLLSHNESEKKECVFHTFPFKNKQEIQTHIQKDGCIQITPTGEKALFACSALKILSVKNKQSLVEMGIYTGRKHQIRVQLAHAGFPLVGDSKYAPQKLLQKNDTFFLECQQITLPDNEFTEQTIFRI